jgi:hypothetical protein
VLSALPECSSGFPGTMQSGSGSRVRDTIWMTFWCDGSKRQLLLPRRLSSNEKGNSSGILYLRMVS